MIKQADMLKRLSFLFFILSCIPLGILAQNNDSESQLPEIYYSSPQKYTIGGITVKGIEHYQEDLLINISGLSVGQEITVPGDDVKKAIKAFWRQGLFSDVSILATKIEGKEIFIEIDLKELPRLSKINYFGLKKGEISDLEEKIQFKMVGTQVTTNMLNNAEKVIRAHFIEKGFNNTEVNIYQKDDVSQENSVIVDVYVDKKQKVKVENLIIDGNEVLEFGRINRAMKKTNEKGKLVNFFRTKKFIPEDYANDKKALIDKYNEEGYRDAIILVDSIFPGSEENTVIVYIKVTEGNQYHFRNISWIGNTQYTSNYLDQQLRIKKGDVYNQKLLTERYRDDEDAVSNLYLNNGYLFFDCTPVEVNVENDSIDLEMRIREGNQATINKIIINGNTKTNEHVVRRELRTKPGQLFSKAELIRSVRELAQLGHFNPEAIEPVPQPNQEDGTVDIVFNLEERPNDQVELSGGWGAGMFVGTLGLSFNNFSVRNIFNKEAYSPLPSGDGQSLSLRAQTNGRFYQSYSASFMEPWLGGKRPNSLSVSIYHSIQTGVSNNYGYYNNSSYYNSSYYGSNSSYYNYDVDLNKSLKVTGMSVGFGKRLSWPDDYFTLYTEASFQRYAMNNWYFIAFSNGVSNNLSLKTTLSRNSIDNPIYTRTGSSYSLSVQLTPPYSLLRSNNDEILKNEETTYKWIEYHKWNLKAATYTPLSRNGNLVLMARAEYGFLGYYNRDFLSPFEKFRVGGDGMSGYSLYGSETIGLRGYENGSITPYDANNNEQGNMYTRLTMELRYPLMLEASSTIYALGFLEAGNAWAKFDQFNPFSLKRSAGAGVRIFLPMFGMMGIDWGYGFDTDNTTGAIGGSQFHFVIGQQF